MNAGAFAAALLDPAAPCPPGLTAQNGSAPAQRFAVYRNNVTVSLVEALADTFPVVRALVGDAFFRTLATAYVRRTPPRSPVLAWYGADFADFVAAYPPAVGVPYLADMARLEYARVLAFHAADAAPLPLATVAEHLADPAQLPALRLQLHPSLAVLASSFAVVSLWAAHQGLVEIGEVDPYRPECALILRYAQAVEVSQIPSDAGRFIAALVRGEALAAAVAQAAGDGAAFDPTDSLGLLLGRQMLVGAAVPGEPS